MRLYLLDAFHPIGSSYARIRPVDWGQQQVPWNSRCECLGQTTVRALGAITMCVRRSNIHSFSYQELNWQALLLSGSLFGQTGCRGAHGALRQLYAQSWRWDTWRHNNRCDGWRSARRRSKLRTTSKTGRFATGDL